MSFPHLTAARDRARRRASSTPSLAKDLFKLGADSARAYLPPVELERRRAAAESDELRTEGRPHDQNRTNPHD